MVSNTVSLIARPPAVLAQMTYVERLGRPVVRVNPGDVVTFDYGTTTAGVRRVWANGCGMRASVNSRCRDDQIMLPSPSPCLNLPSKRSAGP